MTKPWIDFIFQIGYKQAELFHQNNVTYMELMVNGTMFKNLLTTCYNCLVKLNKVAEIESLPKDEKQRLFEIVKDFDKTPLNKEGYVIACRGLYTIEYFLTTKQ